jgi:hypothetical protein
VDEAGQCVLTMILSETLPEVSDSGFGPSKIAFRSRRFCR